jgi:hypothetical protein
MIELDALIAIFDTLRCVLLVLGFILLALILE